MSCLHSNGSQTIKFITLLQSTIPKSLFGGGEREVERIYPRGGSSSNVSYFHHFIASAIAVSNTKWHTAGRVKIGHQTEIKALRLLKHKNNLVKSGVVVHKLLFFFVFLCH